MTTVEEKVEARDICAASVKEFTNVTKVVSAIRKIIATVFDDIYLKVYRRAIAGLTTIPIRDIMATMLRQHGKLRSEHITVATKSFKEPWDPTTPLQSLFKRISKVVDSVEAVEERFSDNQLMRYGYDAVHVTGVFTDAMKVWKLKATTDKTWTVLKIYMIDEYNDYLEDQASNEQHPYKVSNLAEEEVLTSLQEIHDIIT